MLWVNLSLLCVSLVTFTAADYECLCNYQVEKPIYSTADQKGPHIGALYEFDCKPTYQTASTPNWKAVQFEKQVGYIALDGQTKIQTCPGVPDAADLVPATMPTSGLPKLSTSTLPDTTRINTYIRTTTIPDRTSPTTRRTPVSSTLSFASPTQTTYIPAVNSTATDSPTKKKSTTVIKTTNSATEITTKLFSVPVTHKISTAATTPLPSTAFRMSTTTAATTTARVLQCPPRVPRSMYLKQFGLHCYEFIFGRAVKWPDAENDCKRKGGHLVSISSSEEQSFVFNNLRSLHFHGDAGVWIGLTDHHHEGTWTWSSGERVTYTHWLKGQPGRLFGALEDCAVMEAGEHGQWGDYSCEGILFTNEKHGWVCEYVKQ